MTTIHQTFRLKPELVSKCRKEAEKEERSMSFIYAKAVEEYFERKAKKK